MAWTDSIFAAGSDKSKLQLLAKICQAVYTGNFSFEGANAVEGKQRLAGPPLPNMWRMEIDGSVIVAIEGTTSSFQYPQTIDGYLAPFPFPAGGFVNSYLSLLADAVWPFVPNTADLICGHSLGGGLAQLTARRLKGMGGTVAGFVTFGANRPVSEPGSSGSSWTAGVNVANILDPIPFAAPDGLGGRVWRSPGQTYELYPSGTLTPIEQDGKTVAEWLSFLQQQGFAWHATQSYINGLSPALPPLPQGRILEGTGMSQLLRFEVKGLLMAQACDVGMWYLAYSTLTEDGYVDDLADNFRQWILPRLSSQYEVVNFELGIFGKVIEQTPGDLQTRGLLRFNNFIRRAGVATDFGHNANTATSPSFVTVTGIKACSAWRKADAVTVQPGRRRPDGKIQFGGIPRLNTKSGADGNRLLDAEHASWDAAMQKIMDVEINDHVYNMVLFTQYADKLKDAPLPLLLYDDADPPAPTYNLAIVQSLTPNIFVGSRVSRKQTISNRG